MFLFGPKLDDIYVGNVRKTYISRLTRPSGLDLKVGIDVGTCFRVVLVRVRIRR